MSEVASGTIAMRPYPLMEFKNSALLRVLLSLSSSSSMVSTGESGFSTLRRKIGRAHV